MTEKFKKLLCSLISAAMICTNAIAFADADKDEEAADKELIAEMEEAASATPEPEVYDWEADAYYQKALNLCSALGIIEGKDDGEVHPEAVVTRAEMATIVLRLLAETNQATYNNVFTDVDASHWAAQTIQTAFNAEIVNGFDDGTFVPDGDVTTTQVAKMLVCAANYTTDAEYNGGWPQGYLHTADNTMKLFEGCFIKDNNIGCERGNVIKMAYNALLAPYNKVVSSSGSNITYSDIHTWAKVKFDVIDSKGMLLATNTASVLSSEKPVAGRVVIDVDTVSDTYDCELEGIDGLVGKNIIFYYKDTFENGKKVIAMLENATKTETVDIEVADIENLTGFESGNGEIDMVGSKTYRCTDATIIYNGKVLTKADYDRYKATDVNRFKSDINEFLIPECGTIKLVDNDSDKNYDIIYVDSYETFVVSTATNKKIVGTFGYYDSSMVGHKEDKTLDVENNSGDKTITIIKKEMEVKPKNLTRDDIVSMKRSADDMVIHMTVSTDTMTGTIKSMGKNMTNGVPTATIAGEVYDVAAIAYDDCSAGIEGTFYLDSFGRISMVASSSSGLLGSEEYGWIMKTYEDGGSDGLQIQLYTQAGAAKTYSLASTLKYWAPGEATESSFNTRDAVSADLQSRLASSNFMVDSKKGYQIRLVKYKANSKDEITQLYCATDAVEDTTPLVVSTKNLRDTAASGSLISGYYVVDGIARFVVPGITTTGDTSEFSKASNYVADTVTASNYLRNTEGVGRDFIIGQFKDSSANVLVEFTTPASEAANAGDYGTADNNPTFVVDRIGRGIDADGEEIYTVTGYSAGAEVTYKTTQNTIVTRLANSYDGYNDKNNYKVDSEWQWDAKNGAKTASYGTRFEDYVKKGDVFGVDSDGNGARVMIKMVDTNELYKLFVQEDESAYQFIGKHAFSDTRDDFSVGAVTKAELTKMGGLLETANLSISVDASRYFDVVEYNVETGEVIYNQDDTTISDVGVFDDVTKLGDIAFVRQFKGSLQNVTLIRFTD